MRLFEGFQCRLQKTTSPGEQGISDSGIAGMSGVSPPIGQDRLRGWGQSKFISIKELKERVVSEFNK